jgi:hypothetical protein
MTGSTRRCALALVVALGGVSACDEMVSPDPAKPDATLRAHAVSPSTPTPEGLAYLDAVARAHERADAQDRAGRIEVLRAALAMPVPAGLGEAEALRLELAARLGETLAETPEGVVAARDLLAPMLPTARSLPVDRATARALVVLGDAALGTGDDALAAGSYMRAIRVMSMLREELEP